MLKSSVRLPQAVQNIVSTLRLTPHPREGGYFFESYRSEETLVRGDSQRSLATAIYFLVLAGQATELHRLPGDEIFHYYAGAPVDIFLFDKERGPRIETLGNALDLGMRPQLLVPGRSWQAARLRKGGDYSLLGTTMSPGFDYSDYEACSQGIWAQRYPEASGVMNQFYTGE